MDKVIGYFRISGRMQALMRADLEDQRRMARMLCAESNRRLAAEYVDYENGARSPRTQLGKAIEHAQRTGSSIIIPRAGGLARDWTFFMELGRSGCEFHILDMPHASKDTALSIAKAAHASDPRLKVKPQPETRAPAPSLSLPKAAPAGLLR